MFDKMIVSDADGAESKGRSRYFIVSTTIVGILFLTAVVFSIYAVELDLGSDNLELSMMLAPVTPDRPDEPKAEQPRNQPSERPTDTPVRNQNMLRVEEQPTAVPDNVSVVRNTSLERPIGKFILGDGPETAGSGAPKGVGNGRNGGEPSGTGSLETTPVAASEEKIPEPPPVIKPKPPALPVSLGVINGKATSLPKPPYPAAAVAVNAQGDVTVQVTIDETGRVVSAKAINGHPLLRRDSERAAMNARFSPTTLSKVPVKVTGMIVYSFKR